MVLRTFIAKGYIWHRLSLCFLPVYHFSPIASTNLSTMQAPANNMQPTQPFMFLDLPTEIRDIVYQYALDDTPIYTRTTPRRPTQALNWVKVQVKNVPTTSFLLTCKQIHNEYSGTANRFMQLLIDFDVDTVISKLALNAAQDKLVLAVPPQYERLRLPLITFLPASIDRRIGNVEMAFLDCTANGEKLGKYSK